MAEWVYFLLLGTAYLVLFGLAELLFRKAGWQAEHTRKLVHAGSGLLALTFPLVFSSHWWVLALCSSFFVLLVASKKYKFLESINGVDRKTFGSDLFPVAVYFLFLFYLMHKTHQDPQKYPMLYEPVFLFYQPLMLLALCDPIAALVGKRWPWGRMVIFGHNKTVSGSLGFFFSAILITSLLLYFMGNPSQPEAYVIYLVATGILTTIGEMVSTKGTDNLIIVVVASLVNYLFLI